MNSTNSIFRKNNFIFLDKILNNGDYSIEAKAIVNPHSKIFNKPYKKTNKPKANEPKH